MICSFDGHIRQWQALAPPEFDRGLGGNDHYNPAQPRVPAGDPSGQGGRSTKVGGGTEARETLPAAAPAGGTGRGAAGLFATLGRIAARAAGPLGVLGGLLIPTNKMHVHSGAVPDVDGVRFHYDEGFLTLERRAPSGEAEVLFRGSRDDNGYFISADGAALARDFGRGVFIGTAAVRRLDMRTATVGAIDVAKDDGPSLVVNGNVKFCPDVGPDADSHNRLASRRYQEQVTGLESGLAVKLRGARFDGCDEAGKKTLEAKGENCAWAIEGDDFRSEFNGREDPVSQLTRQSDAARDRVVEMSFSIYISAFDKEDSAWIPLAEMRDPFSKHVIHEDPNMLYLQFGRISLPATELGFEVGADGVIDGFFVHHPPVEMEFGAIIAGLRRDDPCLLYWPGNSAVMGSLDLLPYVPKWMIEALGIPLVSTDPERVS